MFGREPDLQTRAKKFGFPSSTTWDVKLLILDVFRELYDLTTDILATKRDMNSRKTTLEITISLILSQKLTNFFPPTAKIGPPFYPPSTNSPNTSQPSSGLSGLQTAVKSGANSKMGNFWPVLLNVVVERASGQNSQHLRLSGLFSCRLRSLELSPGILSGTRPSVQTVSDVCLIKTYLFARY